MTNQRKAHLRRDLRFALAKSFLSLPIIEKYFLAYRKDVMYEFDVRDVSILKANVKIIFREAGPADMEKLVEIRTRHRSFGDIFFRKKKYLIKVLERLKANHRCLIAERNTEILGYVWAAFGELYLNEIERRIILREDEAILYDWYVSPFQRGKGIGPEIWSQSIIRLGRGGYRRIYGFVAPYNKPSRRALEKINGRTKATIVFIKILTMKRLLQTFGPRIWTSLRSPQLDFVMNAVDGVRSNTHILDKALDEIK